MEIDQKEFVPVPIDRYRSTYMVSRDGRVLSIRSGCILKPG